MSTATATPAAGAAAAPAATSAAPSKIASAIRRRAQGLPELTPEELAEAAKVKEAADKVAADAASAKAAEDKKVADEAAAKAAGGAAAPVVEKVRKVKDGPALPTVTAKEATVEEQVRAALDAEKKTVVAPALDPEVQREIDLAVFAEKKAPERYAGMAGKVKAFFSQHDELVAAKAKELGGQKSSEFKDWIESEEYRSWVAQNRPAYVRGDKAKLGEDLIADRARAEAREELAPELKALKRQTDELKHAPEIKQRTNQALGIIISDAGIEKDPALAAFRADPIKFGEAHPEEAQLIASEAAEAVGLIEEVYRIDRDLVDFNPKAPTAQQAKIREFTMAQNAALRAKHPTGIEMGDGKILIDADTYQRQGLHRDARYRVFNADEIAGMIAATKNSEVLAKLARRRDGVSKSIYAPKPAGGAPAQGAEEKKKPDDEPPSPDGTSSRATGGKGKPATTPIKSARDKYLNGKF
jgi:hypothetical protein